MMNNTLCPIFHTRGTLAVLGIFLALTAPALAQQPVVPQPIEVEQGERMNRIDPNEETPEAVNFFGEQALEVFLRRYQEITGKIIIWSAQVQQDQTIKLDAPPGSVMLTPSEQVELIEQTLLLNGYSLIPSGENSVKLINWRNENPRTQAPPVFGSAYGMPDAEQIVTFFMTFDNIAAADAQTVFTTAIPRSTFGEIALVPNVNGLLITENTEVIRRLIELKELIDVPSASVVTEFVELERADAERVAETIKGLLDESQSEQQATGGRAAAANNRQQRGNQQGEPPVPPTPEGGQSVNIVVNSGAGSGMMLSERGLVPGEVKLIPDPRTNSILVVTRPSNLSIIVNLIKAFDRPIDLELPYERQLYYRKANEILPILQNVLTEEEGQTGNIAGGAAGGGGQASNVGGGGRAGGGAGGTGGGSGGSGGGNLQGEAEVAPESVLVGKTLLIADNTSNSILVSGPQENIEKVDKIIGRLDVRGKQVYLSTVIGQLRLNEATDFGINYLQKFQQISNGIYQGGAASSVITTGTGTSAFLIDPRTLVDTDDFIASNGFRGYGTVYDTLDVFVNALQSDSDFKLISRPNVFTANNEPALISSGSRVPVPTSTVTDVSGGQTAVSSNIGFEDVLLSVEIVPLINANREVTLEIYQINDTVTGSVVISDNDVPIISTQELQTTVTVPDRSIVALGGLISEQRDDVQTGLPLLMDIPILGNLFKSTSIDRVRNELIILIQPTVIENESDLHYANFLEQGRNKVAPEARGLLHGEDPEVRHAIPVEPAHLVPPIPAPEPQIQKNVTSQSLVTP